MSFASSTSATLVDEPSRPVARGAVRERGPLSFRQPAHPSLLLESDTDTDTDSEAEAELPANRLTDTARLRLPHGGAGAAGNRGGWGSSAAASATSRDAHSAPSPSPVPHLMAHTPLFVAEVVDAGPSGGRCLPGRPFLSTLGCGSSLRQSLRQRGHRRAAEKAAARRESNLPLHSELAQTLAAHLASRSPSRGDDARPTSAGSSDFSASDDTGSPCLTPDATPAMARRHGSDGDGGDRRGAATGAERERHAAADVSAARRATQETGPALARRFVSMESSGSVLSATSLLDDARGSPDLIVLDAAPRSTASSLSDFGGVASRAAPEPPTLTVSAPSADGTVGVGRAARRWIRRIFGSRAPATGDHGDEARGDASLDATRSTARSRSRRRRQQEGEDESDNEGDTGSASGGGRGASTVPVAHAATAAADDTTAAAARRARLSSLSVSLLVTPEEMAAARVQAATVVQAAWRGYSVRCANAATNPNGCGRLPGAPPAPNPGYRMQRRSKRDRECNAAPAAVFAPGRITETWVSLQQDYDIGNVLGDGTFGVVFRCVQRASGCTFALKRVPKDRVRLPPECDMMASEVRLLARVRHDNVVRLEEVRETEAYVCLVLEYVGGGDLFSRISDAGSFSEADVRDVISAVARALQHLHRLRIVHRDIKPENLLFPASGALDGVKLCDFGLATELVGSKHLTDVCGSPTYTAPEVLLRRKGGYHFPVDIWALGVVTYVMLCGCAPFDVADKTSKTISEKMYQPLKLDAAVWRDVSGDGKKFLRDTLHMDPKKRRTAAGVLAHAWVVGTTTPNHDRRSSVVEYLSSAVEGAPRMRPHPSPLGSSVVSAPQSKK